MTASFGSKSTNDLFKSADQIIRSLNSANTPREQITAALNHIGDESDFGEAVLKGLSDAWLSTYSDLP